MLLSFDCSRNYLVNLLFLEPYNWICLEIRDVDSFSFFDNLRVFAHHKPAAVGEEESACRIMGIGVCVGVFVVLPVITHPCVDGVLRRQTDKINICTCLFMSTDGSQISNTYVRNMSSNVSSIRT